jgi:putative cystathionine gamma-synthase (O-succinylhomoserine (thiol)-lyase)
LLATKRSRTLEAVMAKAASNSSVSRLKSAYILPFGSHPDALEAFTYREVRTLVSTRY